MVDAHCHYHLLDPVAVPTWPDQHRDSLAIVNASSEVDFSAVASYCHINSWARPSFGIHPWNAATVSPDWESCLLECLESNPDASIGEIGLDRCHSSLAIQENVFVRQLELASERQLPVSIHCVGRWGRLFEILDSMSLPGEFLLHGYSGSPEMAQQWLTLNACFSASAKTLERPQINQLFSELPEDRILVETDAPFQPPTEPLVSSEIPKHHHPDNLVLGYERLARIRYEEVPNLVDRVHKNAVRLFQLG